MPCAFDPLFARFWLLCLVHKMTLKVYGDYASQPCRAVPLFLRAAKIPHEVVVLKLMAGEQKSDKITKLNPFGIVIQNIFFISLTFHFKVPFFSCLLLSMMVWSWGNPWPFWGTLPRFLMCLIIGIPRTWWVNKKSMNICIGSIWLLVSTALCTSR